MGRNNERASTDLIPALQIPPRRRLLVGLDLRFARDVYRTSTDHPGFIEALQVEWYSHSLTSNGLLLCAAGYH